MHQGNRRVSRERSSGRGYYYGARYYDPRTSVWVSADPILGKYLAGRPRGGVFTPENLALYSYVGNNPIIYVDPNGQEKYSIGLSADLFVGGGVSLEGGLSFDTDNLEIGANGAFLIGGGVDAGLGGSFASSHSSEKPAETATHTSTSIVFSGNIGPLGITKDVPVKEDGKSVIGEHSENSVKAGHEIELPEKIAKLKPQLKIGAYAAVKYEGKATSDVIPRAINGARALIKRTKHAIENRIEPAIKNYIHKHLE